MLDENLIKELEAIVGAKMVSTASNSVRILLLQLFTEHRLGDPAGNCCDAYHNPACVGNRQTGQPAQGARHPKGAGGITGHGGHLHGGILLEFIHMDNICSLMIKT